LSRSVYLDLAAQHARLIETGEPRFTLPVQAMAALEAALRRLDAETIPGRARRYRRLRARLRDGCARVGLIPIDPPETHRSSFIQTFRAPTAVMFARWREQLAHQGLVIHTDAATLAEGGFYLSVAGDLGAADIDTLIAAFAELTAITPHG
jgi:2-aminoethylphosphonate-pyruvate transaminase